MENHKKQSKWYRLGIQLCVVVVSLLFLAYGMFRGEMIEVLSKASRICLECIGIG